MMKRIIFAALAALIFVVCASAFLILIFWIFGGSFWSFFKWML
jgi:hypothetical protein